MEKDPIALKETKEVLRIGRHLNDEETWYWAQAKTNETTYLQNRGWLDKGIGQFADNNTGQGWRLLKTVAKNEGTESHSHFNLLILKSEAEAELTQRRVNL